MCQRWALIYDGEERAPEPSGDQKKLARIRFKKLEKSYGAAARHRASARPASKQHRSEHGSAGASGSGASHRPGGQAPGRPQPGRKTLLEEVILQRLRAEDEQRDLERAGLAEAAFPTKFKWLKMKKK
jgi:hypothetical protein